MAKLLSLELIDRLRIAMLNDLEVVLEVTIFYNPKYNPFEKKFQWTNGR